MSTLQTKSDRLISFDQPPLDVIDLLKVLMLASFLPNHQNLLAIKRRLGIRLTEKELAYELKVPNSPTFLYFLDMMFCIVRFLFQSEEFTKTLTVIRQLLELVKEVEEESEGRESSAREKEMTILALIEESLAIAQSNFHRIQEQQAISYDQMLELQKASYLAFYSQGVTKPKDLEDIRKAVDIMFYFRRESDEAAERQRRRLVEPISESERAMINERLGVYEDHLRLSGIEMKQKLMPEEILNDPDKRTSVAFRDALNEEYIAEMLQKEVNLKQEIENKNPSKWTNYSLLENLGTYYAGAMEEFPNALSTEQQTLILITIDRLNDQLKNYTPDKQKIVENSLSDILQSLGPKKEVKKITDMVRNWLAHQKPMERREKEIKNEVEACANVVVPQSAEEVLRANNIQVEERQIEDSVFSADQSEAVDGNRVKQGAEGITPSTISVGYNQEHSSGINQNTLNLKNTAIQSEQVKREEFDVGIKNISNNLLLFLDDCKEEQPPKEVIDILSHIIQVLKKVSSSEITKEKLSDALIKSYNQLVDLGSNWTGLKQLENNMLKFDFISKEDLRKPREAPDDEVDMDYPFNL